MTKVSPVFYLNKKRAARVLKDYKDEHDLHSTLEGAHKDVKHECFRLERALEVAGKLLVDQRAGKNRYDRVSRRPRDGPC